jgi:hypothetical protein
MFMFNTQKLHSYIQNYIMIIAQILKCKLYVFYIKTSQVGKTHYLYKNYLYIVIFTFLSPQILHRHIVL